MSNYTTSYGSPVNYPHAAQRASTNGPLLLQDFHHIDNLAHLAHERIPERLVHAKGAGAHGYFEVTKDMSEYTSQPLFQKVGNTVKATVRFSTVAGESGSADTARDVHGFAIKLKTTQGNMDWVFLNTPVFFIRDGGKYPDLVHATKRNPQTNLRDHDMYWDFMSSNPETVHQIMMLFSDRGTPDGFHQQHGYGGTTFKWCKNDNTNTFVYVKVHVKAKDGLKTLTSAKATELAGTDPDYGTRKLYEAIENANNPYHMDHGKYPEWTVSIQTMSRDEAASSEWSYIALDVTKTWPEDKFPLKEVGKLVLNENPLNYFDEIEQLAFSPSHLIPYIEPSPDPLFQSRLFIYPETQRYRLGVNHRQLPCNAPSVPVANYQRAGAASFISQGNRANYQTSFQSLTFTGPPKAIDTQIRDNARHEKFDGTAYRDFVMSSDLTDRDYKQPRDLWLGWSATEQQTYVDNVSEHLRVVRNDDIKRNQLTVFNQVHPDLATRVAKAIGLSRG